MLASAGGGDGGWVTQMMSTLSGYQYQFQSTRGLKCRFLSDGSVVDISQRRYGTSSVSSSYWTTMTKWQPNGDLDTHTKVNLSPFNMVDTTENIIWVDWDDSDTIYVHSRGYSNEVHLKMNSSLNAITWYRTISNQGSSGFSIIPEYARLYAFAGNTWRLTSWRLDNGNAVSEFTAGSSYTVSGMGYDNLYMGNFRSGAVGYLTTTKRFLPMKLSSSISGIADWCKEVRIGKSTSDYNQIEPDSSTTGYTKGASTGSGSAYDLYVGGSRSYPADSANLWCYITQFANSDGSLSNSVIITPSSSTGSPYSASQIRYQGIRALAVGSNGDVWAAHGTDYNVFTILHFASDFTLNKALSFKRLGSSNNLEFSPFAHNWSYSSLDLSQDEAFLVCSGPNASNTNAFQGIITFKIPSDLSCVDATYEFPTTAAGISDWQGTGSNTDTSGTARFKVFDSTSYFTVETPSYQSVNSANFYPSSTSQTTVGTGTVTFGSDSSYSEYGPQEI